MTTAVELPFAGGNFRFHLDETQMRWLEMGRDDRGLRGIPIRIGEAYARLLRGRYELDGKNVGLPTEAAFSIIEMDAIIRAALLGGGGGTIGDKAINWQTHDVDSYIRVHLAPKPLMERWNLCLAVMGARVEGYTLPTVTPGSHDE